MTSQLGSISVQLLELKEGLGSIFLYLLELHRCVGGIGIFIFEQGSYEKTFTRDFPIATTKTIWQSQAGKRKFPL